MAVRQDIAADLVFVGGKITIRARIVDAAGVPVNCTTFAPAFALREWVNGPLVVGKSGASVVVANGAGTGDELQATLQRADLSPHPAGSYAYAFHRTDTTEDVPLIYGELLLTGVADQP